MKSESNVSKECLFCNEMTAQKKHLFFILLKKLSKVLTCLSCGDENAMIQSEYNSFKQLLRVVFGRQASDYESICHHKKYYVYCIQKLKCTDNHFQSAAQKLAYTIAEQNYHLYLLTNQVKNSAETIAQGRLKTQKYCDQPTFYHNKAERIGNKGKRSSQEFPQMEIKVDASQNDEANQVIAQEGGMINSMSYIPVYNSQFMLEPCPTSITLPTINNMGYYYPYQVFYPQNNQ